MLPAKALLQAQGYQPIFPMKPTAEAAFLRSKRQTNFPLIDKQSAVMLELHWMTDTDYRVESITDDEWWANLGMARLDDGKVRSFTSWELFLVLCVHGAKHHWSSLGWLVDAAEMMRQHPQLDWERVIAKAEKLSCERRLAVGLRLAQDLLDVPLPEKIRRKIADRSEAKDIASNIAEMLFEPGRREIYSVKNLLLNIRLYEHTRQKLAYCVSTFLTPGIAELSHWPLPRPFFFLYVPMRLIRLIGKYSAMILLRR